VHLEITSGVDENTSAASELDSSVLAALEQTPLSRTALRAAVHVRNEKLGQILTRLADTGSVVRQGDKWARVGQAVPVPTLA
jgi:hypothetical protein